MYDTGGRQWGHPYILCSCWLLGMLFDCHLHCGTFKFRESIGAKSLILPKFRSFMLCRDAFDASFSVAKIALLGNHLNIDAVGFVIGWSFSRVFSGSIA